MSAKVKKLTASLQSLTTNSEIDGCALVTDRGQLMCAVLPKDVDDKAVSAMAAALISIGGRVGTALGSGNPKNMVIEGTDKMIVLRKVGSAALIGTAPADARIGLIDFEMIKTSEELESIL